MVQLTRLDRYVARLMIVPLFASLTVAAMLLLLERMLSLFNFVINKGGPVDVVWRMLANLMPEQLGFAIPVSLLLAVTLTVRRLTLGAEWDALQAAGFSAWRLLRAPVLFAVLLALVSTWLIGFQQPYSRYAYARLKFELQSGALGASIKVGEFARVGERSVLRVEASREQGRQLEGVFLHSSDRRGRDLAVSARWASFLRTDDPDILLLRLHEGTLIQTGPQVAPPRVLTFSVHDIPIDLPRIEAFRQRSDTRMEVTLPELWRIAGDARHPEAVQRQARGTLHRRLAQIAVLFVLPFLGIAMGPTPKRQASALGVYLGIGLLLLLNELIKSGERATAAGADVALVVWGPFLLFATLSVGLFLVLAEKAGGQPLAPFHLTGRKLVVLGRWLGRRLRWHRLVGRHVGDNVQGKRQRAGGGQHGGDVGLRHIHQAARRDAGASEGEIATGQEGDARHHHAQGEKAEPDSR